MKIYTSYFAKMKYLPKDIIPVSICGKAPDWYTGLQYKKLAPKYDFFMQYKQDHNEEHYNQCFQEQVLEPLSFSQVIAELETLSQGKDVCLLCYEKSEDFCHRHLVGEWIRQNGYSCVEYSYTSKEKPLSIQLSDREMAQELTEENFSNRLW